MATKPRYNMGSVKHESASGRSWRHLVSALSLAVITLNLLIASVPLALVTIVRKLVPTNAVQRLTGTLVDRIYRAAVHVDSFWLRHVLGIRMTVRNGQRLAGARQCIIVSNHQTWFDILVIQAVVTRQGPIVHFLIKEELTYVPVVGWICLMLGFPRLSRGKSETGRARDLHAIESMTVRLQDESAALLNFAEGTRFSEAKRVTRGSDFRYLLNPKTGGMRVMLNALPDVEIIDLTLAYPEGQADFWRCLSGTVGEIVIDVEYEQSGRIQNIDDWLHSRWVEKDRLLTLSRHQ